MPLTLELYSVLFSTFFKPKRSVCVQKNNCGCGFGVCNCVTEGRTQNHSHQVGRGLGTETLSRCSETFQQIWVKLADLWSIASEKRRGNEM